MIKARSTTKKIKVGNIYIGGDAPVSIQSMTNTNTYDVERTSDQINMLENAGCQIVRCSIPDKESAKAIKEIKKNIRIPMVADIHFDYRLALEAIDNGADKIRINPGNIGDREAVRQITEEANKRNIPIRVGVNGGSLQKSLYEKYGGVTADALVESAINNIELLESLNFTNMIVSMKTSNVGLNYRSHLKLATQTNYPIHLGITEAGFGNSAVVKSSIGIGSLLMQGIGNTIRVSLTGDPVSEIPIAKEILSVLDLKNGSIDIVSCPTCARTEVDLEKITSSVIKRLSDLESSLPSLGMPKITVAVMGCPVNGPGEAKSADFGVACGKGNGVIFKKGKVIKSVAEDDIVNELVNVINTDFHQ